MSSIHTFTSIMSVLILVRLAHAEFPESVMRVVRFSAPLELVNIAVLGAHRVRIIPASDAEKFREKRVKEMTALLANDF